MTPRYATPLVAGLVLLLTIGGCASSEPTTGGVFRADIGRAPERGLIASISAQTLQSYGFQLNLVDADRITSVWRLQDPSIAQRQEGVSQVRDRATVTTRRRANDMFNAGLRIEHEIQINGMWRSAAPSPALVGQYESMLEDLERQLQRFMTQN